jgi:hypothetical protein
MKKTITLLASLAILFTSFNAFAEGEDEELRRRKKGGFGVHLNLTPIAFGTYSANLEYGFAKNMSAVLTLGFVDLDITQTVSLNGGLPEIDVIPFRGLIVAPEFRYYFNPNRRPGLDRWFVGGYLKIRSLATSGEELISLATLDPFANPPVEPVKYDINYFGLSAGATFGYMYAMKSGLTFGSWFGIGYFVVSNTTYTNDVTPIGASLTDLISTDFRLGLSIGYRF